MIAREEGVGMAIKGQWEGSSGGRMFCILTVSIPSSCCDITCEFCMMLPCGETGYLCTVS